MNTLFDISESLQEDKPKIINKFKNENATITSTGIYCNAELKPGEEVYIVKVPSSCDFDFDDFMNNASVSNCPENLSPIPESDNFIYTIDGLKVYNPIYDQHHSFAKQEDFDAMVKKQVRFLCISMLTIVLSCLGIIFFLITKSAIIYPTVYCIMFVMGLGWLFTSIKGLKNVLKKG